MKKIKVSLAVILLMFMLLVINTGQVYGTSTKSVQNAQNTKSTSTNSIISDELAGELAQVNNEAKSEIQKYIDEYGSETYGFTAYILNQVRIYSIPFCFIGILIGAIFQYVIGVRKLDTRDKGLGLVVTFITLGVICQILPLVYTIVVLGWRG
ncbi:MAG: hypothetical protein LBL91_06015 [Lachnospiraceae bacterium]|jgi:ABC-type glycerol-3-phosphate transport system permease component|nr:hypothetical protein [Lachnospiraceae bacterium]